MKAWERYASLAVHLGFYVIMIGMPMSGWLMVSASPHNIPTLLFGFIDLPYLPFVHGLAVAQAKALAEAFGEAHEIMAWVAYGLIGLHVGAALKHQFLDRDTIVSRMVPFLKRA
jgi:cytochrome b561